MAQTPRLDCTSRSAGLGLIPNRGGQDLGTVLPGRVLYDFGPKHARIGTGNSPDN